MGYAGAQGLWARAFLLVLPHRCSFHVHCPLSLRACIFYLLHLIFFAYQNTISVSGVGDGITSMAVHPHLPILAIGSMGQVRHTCFFSSLRTLFNTAPAGCSHVFSYYRGTGPPDSVRFSPIYCTFRVPHQQLFCAVHALQTLISYSCFDCVFLFCSYHDGFLGQRIGPISCVAFHPFQASFPPIL